MSSWPLESTARPRPTLAAIRADLGGVYALNGLVGFIFAATGPVAIILTVGARGGLSEAQLASWIFGAFFVNGLVTALMVWLYRQPLVFFWTIPGTVLVGPALGHLRFEEVIGAFLVTGVLMAVLGMLGWVRRAMQAVPLPIVMGMVAGVFLRFGVDLVHALREQAVIAAPMVITFVAVSALPALARRIPPLLGALAVGVVAVIWLGEATPGVDATDRIFAAPLFHLPEASWPALFELVIPLAITVLVVQNGQGVAVLESAGHRPPINAVTFACGVASVVTATAGTVSTCLTGPTNAIVTSSGERDRHYGAALVVAALAMGFGLLAPLFTRWLLATPPAFIATLAGLAMLRVLQSAFQTSFRDRFSLGALVTFIVTVADVSILNIGAPFWALIAGWIISRLLEPADFDRFRESRL